jgi:DNA-binding response OmpR family regulator
MRARARAKVLPWLGSEARHGDTETSTIGIRDVWCRAGGGGGRGRPPAGGFSRDEGANVDISDRTLQVLLIDDDEALGRLLEEYLSRFGMELSVALRAEQGLELVGTARPDVVVLDVMLPGMDGFAALRELRRFSDLPVIMLTARGELSDRVVGLELGADDYLAKPFEPRELVARIQTVLRRVGQRVDSVRLQVGDLELDSGRRTATRAGQPLSLTTGEYELLNLLMRHPGKVLDRDAILDALRGIDASPYDRSVDVTVSRLRAKLGDDPREPRYIKTVRSAGYVLVAG